MDLDDCLNEWRSKSKELQIEAFEYAKAAELVARLKEAKQLAAEVNDLLKDVDFSFVERNSPSSRQVANEIADGLQRCSESILSRSYS